MKFVRGFILSLEPALSLLMLLVFIILLISSSSYLPPSYEGVVSKMHKTDAWLVNDSIIYYGQQNQLMEDLEWAVNITNSNA